MAICKKVQYSIFSCFLAFFMQKDNSYYMEIQVGPQHSQVVSLPACEAEAFGIESRWLHPLVLSESQQDEKSQFSESQKSENKHLNKVYITKHSTDGASCVSEVLVCKYAKALLMMHHSAEKGD